MKKLILLLLLLATTLTASADQLWGSVYQVDPADVYLTLSDHTVIRVPAHTATFEVHGAAVDYRSLEIGMPVRVTFTPVYGYQNYYISSSSLPAARTAANQVRTYIWHNGEWVLVER